MDSSKYKTCTTSRGYTYRYYHALPAVADKPTLLFIHGFPSSSFDWNRQAAYFQPLGYGIIIPDCLGYGGTDKPTEYTEFRQLSLADDIVDVVEAAGVREVIAIGHDWYATVPHTYVALATIHVPKTDAGRCTSGVLRHSLDSFLSTKTASKASRGLGSRSYRPPYSRST